MLDLPPDLVAHLAGLLRAERRRRGTRRHTRALTCRYQALLALVWYRKREEMTMLAAAFGVSRATATATATRPSPSCTPPPPTCTTRSPRPPGKAGPT